ncbi:transglycosylase SLT domain-containing protein [Vibrio parahaemolyticus]|uniref:transglycosylase SLT domain-containing protein n=1 Tax=Vibrio parahaemolyticus TaxID=670 RepID=UPI00084AE0E8|nr:transglycosylase SLT domain-containing protein [Vibrio parahaemolyticus]EGQ9298902.1 lytic transglycosylase domain-containing protein [Vibrio parahaemolyticus]EJO3863072.1 transglycosylase SLT domain-containing protein [Vibrio parahaemolyticus]EJR4296050.1 transglycosylase SLT domain-containing protein [Vibrio parahaemolyticus]ODY95064.1 hypothetical protein BBM32_11160 [Vibrio parahaemolyticus]ODY96342.1 hypothetical protein BBM98_17085 [Vibrio parahaemolyticus]
MFEFLGVTAADGLEQLKEPERSYYEYVIEHGDTGLYKAMPWKSKRDLLLTYKGEIEECTLISSKLNNIHPKYIRTIMRSENGWPGADQKAKNGSGDLGIIQVNPKVWDKEFRKLGVTINWVDVRDDVCANLFIGGVILARRLNATNDIFKGLANYHRYATSDNKYFHYSYRLKAMKHFADIESEYGRWISHRIHAVNKLGE